MKLICALGLLVMATVVRAEPPTFVNPNGMGGYTILRPGQMPTFVNPNGMGGGYTVLPPGEMPTFINPNPMGGWTVLPPLGDFDDSGDE